MVVKIGQLIFIETNFYLLNLATWLQINQILNKIMNVLWNGNSNVYKLQGRGTWWNLKISTHVSFIIM